ncbi:MAG: hypothetical protein U9N33_00945 [Campylobacterota bacterium]|nr:hypothetical protein [Campylobacterota bacterium]
MTVAEAESIIHNEYGKNLNILMIADESEEIEAHELYFIQNFTKIVFSNSYEEAKEYWDSNKDRFDLVVIHIKNNYDNASKLLKHIRSSKEFANILAFTSNQENHNYVENHCYCADAVMPYPLDVEYHSKFLYRFLKKITAVKEMESYISILENIINPQQKIAKIKPFVGIDRVVVSDEPQVKKRRIEDNKLKNIRFNQSHKITANEFMETLDSTIVDKVEEFQEELDNYVILLYDVDDLNAIDSLGKLQELVKILMTFSDVVDSMTTFPIISETFRELTSFLAAFDSRNLEDEVQKKLLVKVLLGLGSDLELWIKAIFIDQSTEDIHYFDASFANNCLEIELLFNQDEFEEDDGDLEFF